MKHTYYKSVLNLSLGICIFGSIIACESFLEIEDPKSLIVKDQVFENDVTAEDAISGIYVELLNSTGFASGGERSVVLLGALSSDEILRLPRTNETFNEFDENRITPINTHLASFWASIYKINYQSNAAIEGLTASTGTSADLKTQLLGEAYFLRAYCHFFAVNFFGKVPIIVTSNYQKNSNVTRELESIVYDQIVNDLLISQELLSTEYPTDGRVRINASVATALLARVYLYQEDWLNAEEEATKLIENSIYSLESDLSNVFLIGSSEAIWQLLPLAFGTDLPSKVNTWEGFTFVPQFGQNFAIHEELLADFESGDLRETDWLNTNDGINYYPFKYKVQQGSNVTESSVIFRLAESYLIRAEARARQNNLVGSILDLDMIRSRAELDLIQDTNPTISQANLLLAIEQERRVELFTEGHRWLDWICYNNCVRSDIKFKSITKYN